MDEISIEEARPKLGDIVDRARLAGHAVTITRYGKPAAVVVSADWFERALGYIGRGKEPPWPGWLSVTRRDTADGSDQPRSTT